ncbi:MAG: FMN-binding glutamate synthase family protein [Thermoleophilaceae bacterium]|nr:FMN-binding glutamate synthase family protein [Thermoleophilaceae bacterium]
MSNWVYATIGVVAALLIVVVYDILQRRHTILRIFPIVGHFRYMLERVGPELRQYIVTDNDEERPFTRDQRRWIYASAKRQNNRFGFGSDNDMEKSSNYLVIKQVPFPPLVDPAHSIENENSTDAFEIPAAKVLGGARGRRHAFRQSSVINISGMSYGALSGRAVEALNRGAAQAGCLQTTGEGGVSPHHLHGGELVMQIGTGYFGCRGPDGRFSLDALEQSVAEAPVRAIEIKLSQGAKPGLGGILPAAKVTPEIARIRGVPVGVDCISPPSHSAFRSVDELLDFVEAIAERTGRPVGIKSAVGQLSFWRDLADQMADGQRGVDFITIDGGEGGTGAAPLAFSDHVSLPFKIGFARVFSAFAERGVTERVVFAGSGRLGVPEAALMAFGLGCDTVNVGREAMLAVGCIQSQRCHTGNCPTGVATHKPWRTRGLDPETKAERTANYVVQLRGELLALARACGQSHPALIGAGQLELIDSRFGSRPLTDVFGYHPDWGVPQGGERKVLEELMRSSA